MKGKELETSEQLRYHFDLSNYSPSHNLDNNSLKLVTLKFKDGLACGPIEEYFGLKPNEVTQSAQRKLKHELYR